MLLVKELPCIVLLLKNMSEAEKNFSKKERDMIGVYLSLPVDLAREITFLAHKHGVGVTKALSEFISVGSMATWALENDDSEVVLRRKDGLEKPLVFMPVLAQKEWENIEDGNLAVIWMQMSKVANQELDHLAGKNNMTTAQLVYSFIEFGLTVDKIDESVDYDLVLREKGRKETKMVLFE